ncbi:hypothetical protein CspeluHIS016_0309730 [Cutaneotrichosporon spelunceum]|uniref:SRP9 domain-containing protein n=1 Tax=Cutaneotrichosporon spelunceum TaxID=1672016 RepID=A0AAD3TUJ4_9TREE|nr:hypothetical protein CspeluHIS016_0309730 [Cutaneotrichosporon spelunceum]
MVYTKTWTEFESAVIDLYNSAPRKARYVVKFEAKTGKLVLKVTDDSKCLMYKTHSAIILNRFETLNHRLLSTIANARRRAPTAALLNSGSAGAGTPAVEGDDPMTGPGVASPAQAPGTPKPAPAAEGGKKKKKKKGKR